jgi:CheY-like chemotaxis protein
MEQTNRPQGTLALLIDPESATRSLTRPLLLPYGLEVIQARSSMAALELLQRLPQRFRLAIVSLEMPDLSGAVLLETLRLFRPGLATLCMSAAERVSAGAGSCLPKPFRADELQSQIAEALAGKLSPPLGAAASSDAVARATAAFAGTASLLEAARELARGMPDEAAWGW